MLRLAFIGSGYNLKHMEVVAERPDVKIVGVFSRDITNARNATRRFGGVPYDDYSTMLEKEEIDAAYIGLPPYLHGRPEEICIEKKIHMFIEKPVSISVKTAQNILRRAERRGIFLFAGYKYRYSRLVHKLAKILEKEKVFYFDGSFNMKNVPEKEWWSRKSMSGGQMVEQAPHLVDLVRLLFGEVVDRKLITTCVTFEKLDIPDSSALLVKCERGAIGCIHSSFAGSVAEAGLEIHAARTRLVLTTGTPKVKLLVTGNKARREFNEDERECRKEESRVFLEAVKSGNGQLLKNNYRDAILTLSATL